MSTSPRLSVALGLLVASLCASGLPACNSSSRDPGQFPVSRDELERNAPSEDPAEATYRRYCISCHGANGRGNSGVTGADFTAANSALATKPEAELLVSVRDGRRGANAVMPAHGPVLTEAQIVAVIAYAKKRYTSAARATPPVTSSPTGSPAPSSIP